MGAGEDRLGPPGASDVLWAHPVPWHTPLPLTCATFLQAEALEDLLKLGVFAEVGQFHVDAATQAGAQVGGASQDVAQVLVPAEGVAGFLEDLLNLPQEREKPSAPAGTGTASTPWQVPGFGADDKEDFGVPLPACSDPSFWSSSASILLTV